MYTRTTTTITSTITTINTNNKIPTSIQTAIKVASVKNENLFPPLSFYLVRREVYRTPPSHTSRIYFLLEFEFMLLRPAALFMRFVPKIVSPFPGFVAKVST